MAFSKMNTEDGGSMTSNFRVGLGYDVHRLVAGRKCVIGGVPFDHDKGPLGHSDADVLLHAICDALLGAVGLGDIGDHFPDSDARYKDADSKVLLKECYAKVKAKGYVLNNLDTILVCETPKIKNQRETIKNTIAKILEVDSSLVSIKATTEEKMGLTGSGEAIAAWATVSIVSG